MFSFGNAFNSKSLHLSLKDKVEGHKTCKDTVSVRNHILFYDIPRNEFIVRNQRTNPSSLVCVHRSLTTLLFVFDFYVIFEFTVITYPTR
jgi:hypothetical protein